MKKENKTIEELLNETKTYWICPISGKQIDAQDVSAIESHKIKIIESQKNKENVKLKEKQLKILNKDFKKISSLEELNDWVKKIYAIKAVQVKDIPFFTIPDFVSSEIVKKETPRDCVTFCFLKLNNGGLSARKILTILMGNDFNAKKEVVGMFPSKENPLFQQVYNYQLDCLQSANKKVGLGEKAILQKNAEYCDLVEEIKKINQNLHDLREKHTVVESKMKNIRKHVLGNKDFEMFLIAEEAKNNNKKMKL